MPTGKARRSPDTTAGAAPSIDIVPIRLDADGYDENGAYYGTGQPVFLVTWPDGASQAIRAASLKAARKQAQAALDADKEAGKTRNQPDLPRQPAAVPTRRPRTRTYSLAWREWKLEVRQSFPSYAGKGRTHLEVRVKSPARAPIPITITGYCSHFIATDELAAAGGAVAFVTSWLDRDAKTKAWAKMEATWRQLELELVVPHSTPQPAAPQPVARRRPKAKPR